MGVKGKNQSKRAPATPGRLKNGLKTCDPALAMHRGGVGKRGPSDLSHWEGEGNAYLASRTKKSGTLKGKMGERDRLRMHSSDVSETGKRGSGHPRRYKDRLGK